MKRSPELTPLSHDHHAALFLAQRLRRAAAVSDVRTEALSYWEEHGREHFREEEDILLPAWFDRDPAADRAMAARIADEHLRIRTGMERLARDEPETTHELGELLDRHVRFEEREVFPLIEAGLDEEALAELGRRLAQAHDASVQESP